MADFNEPIELENIGGNNTVSFIETFNVLFIPKEVNHVIASSGIMLKGSWNNFYGTAKTILPSIKSRKTDAGIIWDVSIILKYPKELAIISNAFKKMLQKPYIIKLTNNNNISKLFGSVNNPMTMMFDILNPGEVSGYDGYQVHFEGIFGHNPYYIE